MITFHSFDLLLHAFLKKMINCKSTLLYVDAYSVTMGIFILVTAGKISIAMDTTEELFRTDEEHR